ncbi:MAG: DUF5994 family protein [Nocardiaceae bacterium]|nr:DUF5994 family protein [Nocardiaceae bacterium]
MTRQLHSGAETSRAARVELKPAGLNTGSVDGAWWPRSRDLVAEVPTLIESLTGQLSPTARVVYHLSSWDTAPRRFEAGGRNVKLDGYRFQPINTVYVVGTDRDRLVLLVVPPGTDPADAETAMSFASTADNDSSPNELLHLDGAPAHPTNN